jgi:hypothetical protein
MSKTNAKTATFLQALHIPEPAPAKREALAPSLPPAADAGPSQPVEAIPRSGVRSSAREGKKHIGAYFDLVEDAEVIEQFARLRARLRLDNTGLMRLMIDETFRKHEAKRAFGDS